MNNNTTRNRLVVEASMLAASLALLASTIPNPTTLFERFLDQSNSISVEARSPGSTNHLRVNVNKNELHQSKESKEVYAQAQKRSLGGVDGIKFFEQVLRDTKKGIIQITQGDQEKLIGALSANLGINELHNNIDERLAKNASKHKQNDLWIKSVIQHVLGEQGDDIYKPKAPRQLAKMIDQAANRNQVPPLLLRSLVEQESGYKRDLVSPAGAVGLAQVLPSTALWLETGKSKFTEQELSVMAEKLKEPSYNLEIGSRYIGSLIKQFDGDIDHALAAYNAGPGAVTRAGGVPNYPETQKYVETIKARIVLKAFDAVGQVQMEQKVSDNQNERHERGQMMEP